jgi:hypothetical protein
MRWLVLAAALAGCNHGDGASDDGGDDGSVGDLAPPDLQYVVADHQPFPMVAAVMGYSLPGPELVTITYTDFAWKTQVTGLGNFLPGSQWINSLGQYGVLGATHSAHSWGTTAPKTLTEDQLLTNLKNAAMTGLLPSPLSFDDGGVPADGGVADPQLVYLVYLPMTTQFTDGNGNLLCDHLPSYHGYDNIDGAYFQFAVLPDCSGVLADVTATASREIANTVTDPIGGWLLNVPLDNPWGIMGAMEVGDLCHPYPYAQEGGYSLGRVWSNLSLSRDESPCVPIPAGEQPYGVTADPPMPQYLPAGQSVTFKVTGWSQSFRPDWQISAAVDWDRSDFDPMATISDHTMSNGKTVLVTLHAPVGAQSGQLAVTLIISDAIGHYWPLGIVVP